MSENIKERKIEIKLTSVKYWLSDKIKFFTPNTDTAPKIGIDSKKDIFAASSLLKLSNLAAVIAIPDLLTPGLETEFEKNL